MITVRLGKRLKMKLIKITEEVCPICRSKIVEERIGSLHSNGHQHEFRVFECGYSLHYIPNYMKVMAEGVCTQSREYKEQLERRQQMYLDLLSYIKEHIEPVDPEYAAKIGNSLPYVYLARRPE